MQFVQTFRDNAAKFSVAVLSTVGAVAAHAQAADPFSNAVTDISTKVGTYGTALVGLAAVGVVFMVGIKYVKKITRAS